jgi:proline racemase
MTTMETERIFTTIDTHTAGGPTRIITSGVPILPGTSVPEKFAYFKEHYDPVRKFLLTEPRGHKDMYGAVLTEAINPDADLGVFFMTASGYLPTCVHSVIGVATAFLHTGALRLDHPERELAFETPAGLISLEPNFRDGKLASVGLRTRPAYVQETETMLQVADSVFCVQLVFSGVFFVLINAAENGLELGQDKLLQFIELGPRILAEANRHFEIRHPELQEIKGFALALFYEQRDGNHFKDIVIGRTGSVDRSPCGAGSGALATLQFAKGELVPHEEIDVEGVIGTHFGAQIVQQVKVGPFAGGVPRIGGSAYVTGFHQFVLDADDPLKEGFLIS